jgi:hypothetical protein
MPDGSKAVGHTPTAVADPRTLPGVIAAEHKIDSLRRLPRNWDGEGALAVSEEVASRAKCLLSRIAERAGSLEQAWQVPEIAPNPDGGLELSWEIGTRWVLLVIEPGQPDVHAVRQEGGEPPRSERLREEESIDMALWALATERVS